jgi:hypothetical protein
MQAKIRVSRNLLCDQTKRHQFVNLGEMATTRDLDRCAQHAILAGSFNQKPSMFRNHFGTAPAVFALSALALSALLASVPGCIVAGASKTTYTGNKVAQSTFEQIKSGSTTIGWVHATLGEPNAKTRDGDDEVWKYTYTEHTESSGAVFLIFAGST